MSDKIQMLEMLEKAKIRWNDETKPKSKKLGETVIEIPAFANYVTRIRFDKDGKLVEIIALN